MHHANCKATRGIEPRGDGMRRDVQSVPSTIAGFGFGFEGMAQFVPL